MEAKSLRFRTGFFRLPDAGGEVKILFDENGNIYDKSAAGEYKNCTIQIDNVRYRNSTFFIVAKETLIQARYEMTVTALREDGKKLELVKLRESGYPRWRVTFPPGHKPSPTPRPRE